MRFNKFRKDRLPSFIKLLRELALKTGDTVRRPFQLRIGRYLLCAGGDIAVVKVLRARLSRVSFEKSSQHNKNVAHDPCEAIADIE